jgi:hypothetical protein
VSSRSENLKKTAKQLRRRKKVVFLQRHSEEFAERTTTFMTFAVVSSLKLNEPSLFRGGFVFWVRILSLFPTISLLQSPPAWVGCLSLPPKPNGKMKPKKKHRQIEHWSEK